MVLALTADAQEFLAQTVGEDAGLFANDGEEVSDVSNVVDAGDQANFATYSGDDDATHGSESGDAAETEETEEEVEQIEEGGEEVSDLRHAVDSGDEASSATFDSGAVAENGVDDSPGTALRSEEPGRAEGSEEATVEDERRERVEGAGGRNAEEDMHDDLDEEASYEAAIMEMMESLDTDLPATTFAEEDEGEWV